MWSRARPRTAGSRVGGWSGARLAAAGGEEGGAGLDPKQLGGCKGVQGQTWGLVILGGNLPVSFIRLQALLHHIRDTALNGSNFAVTVRMVQLVYVGDALLRNRHLLSNRTA